MKIEKIKEPLSSSLISCSKKEGLTFCKSTDYYGLFDSDNLLAITGIIWYSNKAIFKNHYVFPEHRGNGYFKILLDYSIELVKERDINKIEATCTNMSIREYLKRGAKIIKEYKNYNKVLIEV